MYKWLKAVGCMPLHRSWKCKKALESSKPVFSRDCTHVILGTCKNSLSGLSTDQKYAKSATSMKNMNKNTYFPFQLKVFASN